MEFERYRSIYPHGELMRRLADIRHVALDMDGTIYMGMSLFPCTNPFLEGLSRIGVTHSFLTNNPSKSIDDYLHKLSHLGVAATREQMYTTALATIDYIHTRWPEARRLFLLGTPSMVSEFERAGFVSTADDPDDVPDVVVAAFDMTLTYSRLCRAAWWVSQGLPTSRPTPTAYVPRTSVSCWSTAARYASVWACDGTASRYNAGQARPQYAGGHRAPLRPAARPDYHDGRPYIYRYRDGA